MSISVVCLVASSSIVRCCIAKIVYYEALCSPSRVLYKTMN